MTIAWRFSCSLWALALGCASDAGPIPGDEVDAALPGCGDGVRDEGEVCDQGAKNSDGEPDACRTSCLAASCGDHVKDTGEACDDGNSLGGDGCTPSCAAETGQIEGEPNDELGTANAWDGAILHGNLAAGDVDCFSLLLPACAAVSARLIAPCATPATLALFNPDAMGVATGAPGADRCARLDPAEAEGARYLAEGRWYLCVRGLLDAAVPAYALEITVIDWVDASFPIPADQDPDQDGRPDSCDADRDGDGVDNDLDNCPDTPNGPGAPAPAPSGGGFIRQWLTAGPFTGLSSAMACRPTDDDLVAADDARVTPAIGDAAGANTWIVLWSFTDRIEFLTDYGGVAAPREVYSAVYVYSATSRSLTLGVGPDDGARVWLNAVEVADITPCQGTVVDSTTVPVTLNAGWNTLVIKVYDQGGGWGNYVRFLDAGVPVTDLELSLSPTGPWVSDQSDGDADGVGDLCDDTPL